MNYWHIGKSSNYPIESIDTCAIESYLFNFT